MPASTWINDPAAAKLLADCAANPPARRWAHLNDLVGGGKVEGWLYSRRDDRVKQLAAISNRVFFQLCNTDVEQAKAEFLMTADRAITEAVEGQAEIRKIATVNANRVRNRMVGRAA